MPSRDMLGVDPLTALERAIKMRDGSGKRKDADPAAPPQPTKEFYDSIRERRLEIHRKRREAEDIVLANANTQPKRTKAQRRALALQAFRMTMRGAPVDEIARELKISTATVRLAVAKVLDSLAPTENERTRARALWRQRLESLVAPFYGKALIGDTTALDSLLKIADRVVKFLEISETKAAKGNALAQVVIRMEPTSGLISPGITEEEMSRKASLTLLQAGSTLPRPLPKISRASGAWADLLAGGGEEAEQPCPAEPRADEKAGGAEADAVADADDAPGNTPGSG